jgi:hypothetical protein
MYNGRPRWEGEKGVKETVKERMAKTSKMVNEIEVG